MKIRFTYSLNKYLERVCYVPGTILDPELIR